MLKEEAIAAEIPRLRRYARALVGNISEADDLVQDALERALGRIGLWTEGDNPRRWLFTIMHNIHIDKIRERARRPVHTELNETLADPLAPTGAGVTNHEIEAALRQLPDDQRQVVLLVGMEGLSYKETAGILNVPIGTVMSRLARGREKLRDLVGSDTGRSPVIRRIK